MHPFLLVNAIYTNAERCLHSHLFFQLFNQLHEGNASFVLKLSEYSCSTCYNIRLLQVRKELNKKKTTNKQTIACINPMISDSETCDVGNTNIVTWIQNNVAPKLNYSKQ